MGSRNSQVEENGDAALAESRDVPSKQSVSLHCLAKRISDVSTSVGAVRII